jgi:hypothetical protein
VPWTAFRNVIRSALVSATLGFVNASAPRLFVARLRNSVLSAPSSRFKTTMLPEGMCLLDFDMERNAKPCIQFKPTPFHSHHPLELRGAAACE